MANSFTPQQIEEFLQEFFDVVGTRQYTGARYVPIFGRAGEGTVEWDDTAPYEPLTVVMHQGVSYVSRRYVPSGIQVTDTEYWVETYRFNAQVEQYRQETLNVQANIDLLEQMVIDDYVPFPTEHSKYGTSGQVMTTLGDGGTRWVDPVTVTAEIAQPIIDQWLDDNPQATTTVEDNSITTAKLADGAVTDGKLDPNGVLSDVGNMHRQAVVDYSGFDPVPGYINTNGDVVASTEHYHIVIPLNGIYRIGFTLANATSGNLPFIVAKAPNGNVVGYKTARNADTYSYDVPVGGVGGTLYLNWFSYATDPSQYCDKATIYANANILDELILYSINEYRSSIADLNDDAYESVIRYENQNVYASRCYMTTSGTLSVGSGHCVVVIPSDNVRRLAFRPLSAPSTRVAFAVVKDSSDNVVTYVQSNGTNEVSLDVNTSNGKIYLNYFNVASRDLLNECTATFSKIQYLTDEEYQVWREFAGANIYGFGDSIMHGVTGPDTSTQNNFAKVFADAVGANLSNYSVSGSAFTSGYNQSTTIPAKVQATTLTGCNVMMVAGGVNDCQLGVTETDFSAALDAFLTWLSSHYFGQVIFVLPINFSRTFSSQILPLELYRDYIRVYATKYGHKYIDTTSYGFPTGSTPTETGLAQLLYGDGLHPTELGHEIYGKTLARDIKMLAVK